MTQNVDGLHDLAGCQQIRNIEGDIWRTPPCPEFGGILRPGVVWFGKSLPGIVWDEAERAVARADVYLVVGTRFLQRTALLLRGSCAEVLPRLW